MNTPQSNATTLDIATSLLSAAGSICTNNHCENPRCYTDDQDDIKTLCTDYLDLLKKHEELREALEKIADVTSAIETRNDGRKSSYGDWELRLIARKALSPQPISNEKNWIVEELSKKRLLENEPPLADAEPEYSKEEIKAMDDAREAAADSWRKDK